MADLYTHTPLSSLCSIRILKLHPSKDEDSPINIDLDEVSIDSEPKYYALSYTWGGQQPSCPIRCGGRLLLTTPNCLAALKQLRDEYVVESYWIDSICIDQTCLSEKCEQVALMGDIYRDASMVVAWLGESDPATEGAIECLKSLVDIGPMNPLDEDAIRDAVFQKAKEMVKEKTAGHEDRIGPLFKRPWFTRLWTVQEVALADPHKVQVVCGQNAISWTRLMGATESLLLNGYRWGNYREAMALQKDLTIYLQQHLQPEIRIMLEQKPSYNMHTPSVSHILSWTRSKNATEPKDMVFGLLGIFTALGINSLVPDYTSSVEEIYRQAATMAISHDRNLDILFEVASDNRRTDLNSWVPDWSDKGYAGTDMRGAITNAHFCASGPADPIYHFSAPQTHLHLRGKLLDTVIYRAETINNMRSMNEIDALSRTLQGDGQAPTGDDITTVLNTIRECNHAFRVMRTWTDVSTWYASYPAPGETPKTALRRTLLYDDPETNGKEGLDASFESWYHVMTTSDAGLDDLAWGSSRNPTATDSEEARTMKLIYMTGMDSYFFSAAAFSNRKCLFTTEKGYLGTGPELIRDGDRIAVLAGVCMPLVLRPVEGGFRLVTHAYIHGIMYGEAWPGGEDRGGEDRDGVGVEEIVLV